MKALEIGKFSIKGYLQLKLLCPSFGLEYSERAKTQWKESKEYKGSKSHLFQTYPGRKPIQLFIFAKIPISNCYKSIHSHSSSLFYEILPNITEMCHIMNAQAFQKRFPLCRQSKNLNLWALRPKISIVKEVFVMVSSYEASQSSKIERNNCWLSR